MAVRKTVKLDSLTAKINAELASSNTTKEQRQVLIRVLESMLFEANAYNGFKYLTKDQVPAGELPGINKNQIDLDAKFNNTDNTRVCY